MTMRGVKPIDNYIARTGLVGDGGLAAWYIEYDVWKNVGSEIARFQRLTEYLREVSEWSE